MYVQKHNKSNFRSNHRLKNIKSVIKIIVHFYLCMSISVFIFVHCFTKTQKQMKSYLMEFFNVGNENHIVYRPLLSIRVQFKDLDACIEEGERIKTKYNFHLCKITE